MPGGNYIKVGRDSTKSTYLIFSPPDEEIGTLARYLKIFEKYKVNLFHIESRPSVRVPNKYEFVVECAPSGELGSAISEIKDNSEYFNIITRNQRDDTGKIRTTKLSEFLEFYNLTILRFCTMVPKENS